MYQCSLLSPQIQSNSIIVCNEDDNNPEIKNLYTFKQVQEMGRKLMKEKPGMFNETMNSTKENDICTIIYTSGTTGEPKGVVLTYQTLTAH